MKSSTFDTKPGLGRVVRQVLLIEFLVLHLTEPVIPYDANVTLFLYLTLELNSAREKFAFEVGLML